jgi:gamma-glutamylcyclotransferase (GGCT)/AIG2-like uncharacterized protein YtfP
VGLSKSRYTVGLQCHRRLWWTVHEREAPELVVGPELQAVFDQGHRVGEVAQGCFPGGTLIDLPPWKLRERVDATRAALDAGASVIYEASFMVDDVFVAVDVLHRAPGRRGWTITEVKSTLSVKEDHVPDAAVQAHVVRAVGLPVSRVEIMHLNGACRFPDLSNLFVRSDVTDGVKSALAGVPAEIAAQLATLGREAPPEVAPGPHCTDPRECPFMGRCWPPAPEHSIHTLLGGAKQRAAFAEQGHATILDLPDDVTLNGATDRQHRAVKAGGTVADPGLADALAALSGPVAHLDFETIAPAIPVWPGCSPYGAVPVQFSVRIESGASTTSEVGWLAEIGEDPRPALASALVDGLRGTGSVIVYNKGFESTRLDELARAVPSLATELRDVATRLVDLLPIVRAHVYHPAFHGSFSLKAVAPALVPGFAYDDLDVGDGGAASIALAALILRGEPADEEARAALRQTLLAYCARDTLGTAGVLASLRALALEAAPTPLYFAYGSNLNTDQMRERCPGARAVGRAMLPDHALAFVGTSKRRGGGVANVVAQGGIQVQGLVYTMTDADWAHLDKFEGHPKHYRHRTVDVVAPDGASVTVQIYVHCSEACRAPSPSYLALLRSAYAAINMDAEALDRAATIAARS